LIAFAFAAIAAASTPARAQVAPFAEIALKSGESTEVTDLLWTVRCKSFLKGIPEVEILDGPPGVSAIVAEKMVLPRMSGCAKKVSGGVLTIKAGEITDDSTTDLRLRLRYNTLEGRRDRTMTLRVTLIPAS
jgi:hypothetical protein